MNQRDFFDQEFCERCHDELSGRTTSWFTTETICLNCSLWEDRIIDARDESRSELEGVGSVPSVSFEVKWGEQPDE